MRRIRPVYQCEKSIEELGDKLDAGDKAALQSKEIDALKETLKGEDYDTMKAQQEELMKAFYDISAKILSSQCTAAGRRCSSAGRCRSGGT